MCGGDGFRPWRPPTECVAQVGRRGRDGRHRDRFGRRLWQLRWRRRVHAGGWFRIANRVGRRHGHKARAQSAAEPASPVGQVGLGPTGRRGLTRRNVGRASLANARDSRRRATPRRRPAAEPRPSARAPLRGRGRRLARVASPRLSPAPAPRRVAQSRRRALPRPWRSDGASVPMVSRAASSWVRISASKARRFRPALTPYARHVSSASRTEALRQLKRGSPGSAQATSSPA